MPRLRAPFGHRELQQAPLPIPIVSEAHTRSRLADGIGDLVTRNGLPETPEKVRRIAALRNLRIAGDRVQVVIHLAHPVVVDRGERRAFAGVEVTVDAASDRQVQGWVRLEDLGRLASSPEVLAVTAPRLPERTVVSEGVAHVRATTLHALGIRGQGRKVGILDVGFSGYQNRLGSELPTSVVTRSFYGPAPGDITGEGEVHGVAVAEVVHDLVPDAQLYLVNFDSEVTFRTAVDWLVSQGVHVITTSTGTYLWEGVDGRGPAARKASSARDAGILFTAAAGNDGNAHYRATFTPSSVPQYHRFRPEGGNILILASDGTDVYYIPEDAPIIVGLVWDDWGQNDGIPTSTVDYDLHLLYFDEGTFSWTLLTSSAGTQNGSAFPREWIGVYAPFQAVYGVVVAKKSTSAPNRPFDLHVLNLFGDELPLIEPGLRTASQSIVSPCVGERVLCIGATDLSDDLAPYSSQGPSHPRPDGTTLPKPDFTAPTHVSTATFPKAGSTPDGFGGTSASAPHAAGVAALFLQLAGGNPDVAETQMRRAAVDLGPPGRDDAYGWGRVRAVPCWADLCDDGLFCTTDRCDETRGCLYDPGPEGCLIDGVCYAPGQPNPSNPCLVCNPSRPTAWSPVNEGTPCEEDGLPCTADVCSMGACTHFVTTGCLIDGTCWIPEQVNPRNPCQWCSPVERTRWTDRPVGSPCEDGLFCTVGETCDHHATCGGGMSRDCSAVGDSCNDATCHEGLRACVKVPREDRTPCPDDGNHCTEDWCQAGTCIHPPVPNTCGDRVCGTSHDGCTLCGTCPEGLGCTADGRCSDLCAGVQCPECLACDGGTCTPVADGQACTSDGNPCTLDVCQEGTCRHDPVPGNPPCEDGLYCTVLDRCQGGVCTGTPRTCTDLTDECRVGVCSEESRSCVAEPLPDGSPCGDEGSCADGILVRPDSCREGRCLDGGTVDCSPYAGCTPEGTCRTTCDDGRDCIAGYRCVGRVCLPNRPPIADAGEDREVPEETEVRLDGTGSRDPDGDPLTYLWVQTEGPEVLLADPRASVTTFVAPSVVADTRLVFQLVVFDGLATGVPDQVAILVRDRSGIPEAGEDDGADGGEDSVPRDEDPGQPDPGPADVLSEETSGNDDAPTEDLSGWDAGHSETVTDLARADHESGRDSGPIVLDLVVVDVPGEDRVGNRGGGCTSGPSPRPFLVWTLPLLLGWIRRNRSSGKPNAFRNPRRGVPA